MERKNKQKWTEDTKVLKRRSRLFWEGNTTEQRKILFDD